MTDVGGVEDGVAVVGAGGAAVEGVEDVVVGVGVVGDTLLAVDPDIVDIEPEREKILFLKRFYTRSKTRI